MRINALGNTATDFASDDYIAIDGATNASRKMKKDSLLKVTAQNALAGNVAPAFVPNETNAKAGMPYIYGGELYVAKEDYNGIWNASKFAKKNLFSNLYENRYNIDYELAYYTSTSTTPSKLTSSTIKSAIMDVSEGDVIKLKSTGTSTAKPYILLNDKDRIVRVCDTDTYDGNITVGKNETKLIVQFQIAYEWDVQLNEGNSFGENVNVLRASINRIYGDNGFYRDCSGDTVPSSKVQSSSYSSGIVYARVGDEFTYYGWTAGSSAAICIATFDRKGNFVRKINDNHITSPLTLTIESGEVGFVWNGLNTYSFLLKKTESIAEDISNLQKEILDKVILDGDVSIPYINARKTIQLWCDKCFRLHAKVKFPKSYTKSPTGSLNIGSFAKVIPQIQGVAVAQHTSTYEDSGYNTVTQYWPYLDGGVKYNGVLTSATRLVRLSGDIAFSIQYTGNEDDATISNDGTNLVITEGATSHTFVLANYSTMKALYQDITALENFAFNFGAIENKTPDDLILFGQVKLKSKFYGYTSPDAQSQEEYVDAAPFHVQYADESWHELDVVGGLDAGGKIITAVDGIAYAWTRTHTQKDILTFDFYGHSGFDFEFRDVIINTTSYGDAEYIDPPGGSTPPMLVSATTPLITVFEGHAIVDALSSNTRDMGCTTDRLATVLSMYRNKGYEFVTMDEILDYYSGGRPLPKRSLTACFDDYQFEDVLTITRRRALTSNGFRFNLAVITNKGDAIHYGNDTITLQQAVDMVRNLGGDCYTHTKSHTRLSRIKPSELAAVLQECIEDADLKNIKSTMLVYPNGDTCGRFSENTMAMLGMSGGLEIAPGVNSAANSKYSIRRVEIGERQNMEYITNWCL